MVAGSASGSPVATQRDRPRPAGWLGANARTLDLAFGRPSLWPIALAGFLARGGFVLLLVPIFPIPTAVGLANMVGPTAVTAAGLAPGSVALLVTVGLAILAWYVGGSIVGAGSDIVLADAVRTSAFDDTTTQAAGEATAGLVLRLIGIRIVALIPLAVAVAVTARPIFDVLYRQLTAPSQVAEPLLSRIVMDASGPIAVVAAGWFIGDVVGGIAVRYAILADLSIGRAVLRALIHIVRRPVTTVLTAAVGAAGLALTLGPSLAASAAAWNRLHGFVADQSDLTFVVVSAAIAGTWLGALVFAAAASAWRGLLWSNEVARAVDATNAADRR